MDFSSTVTSHVPMNISQYSQFSQESNAGQIFDIIFVTSGNSGAVENLSEAMKATLNLCEENYLKTQVVSTKELPPPKAKDIWILDEFKGPVYKKLYKKQKELSEESFMVVGPQFLQYVLKFRGPGYNLRGYKYPVYSLTLEGVVATLSGFADDKSKKEQLMTRIKLLAGTFNSNLTTSVSLVIASKSYSPKCLHAKKMGVPIVKSSWIDCLWSKAMSGALLTPQELEDTKKEHACPLFFNIIISLSQISSDLKTGLQDIVQKNGGTCQGELIKGSTDILVASKAKGQKYTYAQSWGIPCVSPSWVQESFKKGILLPFEDYPSKSTCLSSTLANPAVTNIEFPDTTACSQIPRLNQSQVILTQKMKKEAQEPVGDDLNDTIVIDTTEAPEKIQKNLPDDSVKIVRLNLEFPGASEASSNEQEEAPTQLTAPGPQKRSNGGGFEILEETQKSIFKKPDAPLSKSDSHLSDQENIRPEPSNLVGIEEEVEEEQSKVGETGLDTKNDTSIDQIEDKSKFETSLEEKSKLELTDFVPRISFSRPEFKSRSKWAIKLRGKPTIPEEDVIKMAWEAIEECYLKDEEALISQMEVEQIQVEG